MFLLFYKHININLFVRYANEILIGDYVLVAKKDKIAQEKVIDVSSFIKQGNNFFYSYLYM